MTEPAGADPAPGLLAEAQAFLALALPMTVSRVGVAAMGIADGVMVSRHSTEQFAVLGQGEALMGRVLDMAMMLATAGLALAAQARAGGDATARSAGRVWHHALALGLLAGLAGLLFGASGSRVLALLGQPEPLVSESGRVIGILSFGMLPALVALASAGLLEALGRPVVVAVAVVLANGLNVALNAVLVFDHGDRPGMGAAGAAWSTTAVRWALAAALVAAVWWMSEHRRYGVRGPFADEAAAGTPAVSWRVWWRQGREQRARGWAGCANVAVLASLSLALPVMAGWLGTFAVAQTTALWLVLAPMMVLAWGMGDAAGLRVAVHLGQSVGLGTVVAPTGRAGATGALRRTGDWLAGVLLAVVLAIASLYLLAPEPMVRWAAHDPELAAGVMPLLPLGITALVCDALAILYSSMLRSLGVLRSPFVVHAATGLVLLPLAWGLTFGLGWGVRGLLAAHMLLALVRVMALAGLYRSHAGRIDTRAALVPA